MSQNIKKKSAVVGLLVLGAALAGCSGGSQAVIQPSPVVVREVSTTCYKALQEAEQVIEITRQAFGISVDIMGQNGIPTSAQTSKITSLTSQLRGVSSEYTTLRDQCYSEASS